MQPHVHGDFAEARQLPLRLSSLVPKPPSWVNLLLGDAPPTQRSGIIEIANAGSVAQFSTSIPGARNLPGEELRARVTHAYEAIWDAVAKLGFHPVRFWNFLPAPGDPMDGGLDRYMVFNAGRYDAYAKHDGTVHAFSHRLATASAVGVTGTDLTIFCLAFDAPGTPVENPRQTSSWRYSTRYGPKPPCFARATLTTVNGQPQLLIGGTASIVGEDSRHAGDPEAQVEETLTNLRALIAAARAMTTLDRDDMARLTDVRAYVRRSADAPLIQSMLDARCPALSRLEMYSAQVCRPELLVEIEGVAAL